MSTPKYQPHDVIQTTQADGSLLLTSNQRLGDIAARTTDWLEHWAVQTPNAVFLAERSGAGWRELTFAQCREQARAIAAGLLDLELGPDTPIMIVSGNSVDHGLLMLAAQYVGVPLVPVAEQYALIPDARKQLDFVAGLVRPGAVFAENGDALADVLQRDAFAGMHKLVSRGTGKGVITLASLAKTDGDIESAAQKVGPDTVAKILMTSGSTSAPKGVLTTHRMMCTNQAQISLALPFLSTRPPCIVDWLPWNHVFGGSHNFNMMLSHGGSFYIDNGKPVPGLVDKTIENLRLKTGTLTFNVPIGFAMLRDVMRTDTNLRQSFFENLDMLVYAGASLPQDVWADLEEMARDVRGDMPLFTSSWGLTETAPAVLYQHEPTDRSGVVGVPLAGIELKLIPDEDMRCEVRVKGPNIFTNYFGDPEKTKDSFDDDGFFKTGDAMKFVTPGNPNMGLRFDGRISEDFKLMSGTWVRAANLRLDILGRLAGLAADVVITGADRMECGIFIFPTADLRETNGLADDAGALIVPGLAEKLQALLGAVTGPSSNRITRCMVLSELPQLAEGEITAKGNLNFRKLLTRRAVLLERLYDNADPATIMIERNPK